MFSDSKNYPPACIKVKCLDRVPPCVDRSWKGLEETSSASAVDISGAHRHLFYCRPNVSALTVMAVHQEDQKEIETEKTDDIKSEKIELRSTPKSRTFGVQTDYRESETQTLPYSPDVVIGNYYEESPMILSLKNLKWGQGLPPGLQEIENIEWEINHKEVKAFLLDPDNIPESKRPAILEYIHQEEWLHREKEIQGVHDLRMVLAEKMMHKRGEDLSDRLQEIIKRKYENKLEENWRKVMKIRETHRRELRKLTNEQKGISMKYKRPDPITEQADYSSELYGPLMRHGVDPRRRHEVPLSLRSKFLHDYKGLGILEQTAKWMKTPELVPSKVKTVGDELCTRSTRWSDEQLILLQKYFKGLSELDDTEAKSLPKLMVPVPKPSPRPVTPKMEGMPESEEKLYQAAVFMQKMIRGRAIQMLMFKGKERSKDMIDELSTTHSVLNKEQNECIKEKTKTLLEYQEELEEKRKEEAYENMLSMLVGDTIGSMLDFLSKELVRLKDERCIHALLLLAERERLKREAEEAGRRQVEERRMRENDEVFKQVVKVHQETVDIYLEDIVLNAMEWVSTQESRNYIKELARNIDQKTKDMEERKNLWECKELVTEIVYDFMLPEVYKQLLDQDREKEQEAYIQAIQDEVYNTLADSERKSLQPLEPSTKEVTQGDSASENVEKEECIGNEILDQDMGKEEEEYLQTIQYEEYKVLADSEREGQEPLEPRSAEEEQTGETNEETVEEEKSTIGTVDHVREEGQEQNFETIRDEMPTMPPNADGGDQRLLDLSAEEAEQGNPANEPTGEERSSNEEE